MLFRALLAANVLIGLAAAAFMYEMLPFAAGEACHFRPDTCRPYTPGWLLVEAVVVGLAVAIPSFVGLLVRSRYPRAAVAFVAVVPAVAALLFGSIALFEVIA
jgi:hypothetical protein